MPTKRHNSPTAAKAKPSPAGKNQPFTEVPGAGFQWFDVRQPTKATLVAVKKRLPLLDEEDLDDCLPPFERPKLLEREGYLFIVLLYPVYDRKTRTVRPTEVDCFIGRDFLVMSHEGVLPEIDRITRRRALGISPAKLVLEMAHDITVSRFPLTTDVSNELMDIERQIFGEENGGLIKDILRVRSNILAFREAMQGHAAVFRRLLTHADGFFDPETIRQDCEELTAHLEDLEKFLAGDKETAEALYDSHLSLVTMKTNQAMRTLTVLSFMVFPMTLVATVFSMRVEGMPFVRDPHGFTIVLGMIFSVMLALAVFVRRKKLL